MKKRRQPGRSINGILLLDKPLGISSNEALQQVKRLYHAKKAGHTGSLDPLASGMLPICFGEATKFSQFLLDADKQYYVVAKLGIKTTTADAEGETLETRTVNFTPQKLQETLQEFTGEIEQVPSMYSAIKHQGQPLYKLARQGIEVERSARRVFIHQLTLLAQSQDTLSLQVTSSKGTYIRNLIEDIGEALGCGAHVIELRRLQVAHYPIDHMLTLEQLVKLKQARAFAEMDDLLLLMETAVETYQQVQLSSVSAFQLRQGNAIQIPHAPEVDWVRLYDPRLGFIGVGEIQEDGKVAPKRLIKS